VKNSDPKKTAARPVSAAVKKGHKILGKGVAHLKGSMSSLSV
jgi:hypothetical protein